MFDYFLSPDSESALTHRQQLLEKNIFSMSGCELVWPRFLEFAGLSSSTVSAWTPTTTRKQCFLASLRFRRRFFASDASRHPFHTLRKSLIPHSTTTMAITSVATANKLSKEASLIEPSASQPHQRFSRFVHLLAIWSSQSLERIRRVVFDGPQFSLRIVTDDQ
jgi:hypothetical protein